MSLPAQEGLESIEQSKYWKERLAIWSKHAAEINELPRVNALIQFATGPYYPPSRDLSHIAADLSPWWVVQALRVAAEYNMPEDFKSLLRFLLKKLSIKLPENIIAPSPGKRGRPANVEQREHIIKTWELMGRPGPTTAEFAAAVYGNGYRGGASERKKLRDRCGRIISHHLKVMQMNYKKQSV